MKPSLRLVLLGGAVVVLAGVVWLAARWLPTPTAAGSGQIRVSGNFEVTDAEVSFRVAGRVERRLVDEGQAVQAGQLVAVLDTSELDQDVAQRQADVQTAQAALDELLAGSRKEDIAAAEAAAARARAFYEQLLAGSRKEDLTAAEAAQARAQANLDLLKAGARAEDIAAAEAVVRRNKAEVARLDLERKRYAEMVKADAAALQAKDTLDAQYAEAVESVAETTERLKVLRAGSRPEELAQAAAALDQAKAQCLLVKNGPRPEELAQAKAAFAQAQAQYELVKNGPRPETIAQARGRLGSAQAALALARTRQGFARLTAPFAGMVLTKGIEPGEYVQPGTPVVTVGDLEHIWLRAYIRETDLGRVKLGQRARITTDTYPGKVYPGTVGFIASEAEFTPKTVQTEKERVTLVYRIKIYVENPKMELKPGMPGEAVVETE